MMTGDDLAPAQRDRPGAVAGIEVAADEAGLRLDRWFRRHYPRIPHGRLERWLRLGQVRVDGHRAQAGQRLTAGQTIRVPPVGDDLDTALAAPQRAADTVERRTVAGWVLYQDDDVVVINKPAGLAVQGGTGVGRPLDAMLDGLAYNGERPRLVHRLDKDTAGVLVLARSAAAAASLASAFRTGSVRKLYWAMVVGAPAADAGRIDAPLGKRAASGGGGERVVVDADAGARAITAYRVRERVGRRAAWLELEPHTGRTHQLRVHCLALGTPILGDGKYGGRSAFLAETGSSARLHLHARAISFAHPAGGVRRVVAPLPEHMRATWAFFGLAVESSDETLARWRDAAQEAAARKSRSSGPLHPHPAGSKAGPARKHHVEGK